MENITLTSIDLAKDLFEIWSENHVGRKVLNKRVRRGRGLNCF